MTAKSNPAMEFPRPYPRRIESTADAPVLRFPSTHELEAKRWTNAWNSIGDVTRFDVNVGQVVVVTRGDLIAALTVAPDKTLDLFVGQNVIVPKPAAETWMDVRAKLVLSPLTQGARAFAEQLAASNPELIERLTRRAAKVEATLKVVEKALALPVLDSEATDLSLYDDEGLPR